MGRDQHRHDRKQLPVILLGRSMRKSSRAAAAASAVCALAGCSVCAHVGVQRMRIACGLQRALAGCSVGAPAGKSQLHCLISALACKYEEGLCTEASVSSYTQPNGGITRVVLRRRPDRMHGLYIGCWPQWQCMSNAFHW